MLQKICHHLPSENAARAKVDEVAPFLKWAGGKRWLAEKYICPKTLQGKYFEPFLGSAAMFFYYLPSSSVLSDANHSLVETYQALRDDFRQVVSYLEVHATRHSKDYYYQIRDKRFRKPHTRAAQFIYLNRTCWNGLYRVNLNGKFNVPKGTKQKVLLHTDNFEGVARALVNSEITCVDFESQIDRAEAKDFLFVDPPYTVKYRNSGFLKYNETLFSWDDQIRLAQALVRAKKRGVEIIMTNADHASIRELYQADFKILQVSRYSAIAAASSDRGQYAELLVSTSRL